MLHPRAIVAIAGNRQGVINILNRDYQYGFSNEKPYLFDVAGREKKARTMVAVIGDYLPGSLKEYNVLNVGGSTGIIDNYLAGHFNRVVGTDIDEPAISHATNTYIRDNLEFKVADALHLPFENQSFDVVVCSHVYEHVPDPYRMFEEIYRVLKPGGICYFSAGNRLMWNEPHYDLPLLSVVPRPLAHVYIRMAGKAGYYHEKHLSYWSLRKLVKNFKCTDYTIKLVTEPEKFFTDYLIRPGSLKAKVATAVLKIARWASPGYIWVLEK
jgi:ubiquinone/menaquinone biosynthesis C-methylase UbiE